MASPARPNDGSIKLHTKMYIRFVTLARDPDSHHRQGIFAPSYDLIKSGQLSRDDCRQLKLLLEWFEEHLPLPDRSRLSPRAIFWFKSDDRAMCSKIWPIADLLGKNRSDVELVKTRKPGYIVYGDRYQIAATPFHDTFRE